MKSERICDIVVSTGHECDLKLDCAACITNDPVHVIHLNHYARALSRDHDDFLMIITVYGKSPTWVEPGRKVCRGMILCHCFDK